MNHIFSRKHQTNQPITSHPAYAVGEQIGHWFVRQEQHLADWLNHWQGRVSFLVRNAILLAIFLVFTGYFLWIFTHSV